MKLTHNIVSGVFLAIALFAVATPGWPAEGTEVEKGGQHLQWNTPVQHDGGVLTVAAPSGEIITQEFGAGETPKFTVIAKNGDVHPDGSYTFELRFYPKLSEAQKQSLAESRDDARSAEFRIPVVSGTFGVVDGSIVAAAHNDTDSDGDAAAKDVLHYDDVIITGSLCVGWDCANGESFGYDTHKLKENNLRLFFQDTSIGSFPSGDWRIRINDTTSGGASYFAIEDDTNARTPFRIETGAPNHSLYVEDYGRVGLGTSIPYVELHIADGDSPTIRLDQDGSAGWTAQRWDMAGNETNFFVRDVTNGSKLSFRIQPNTPSNTLSLRSTGYVGIGTWSPDSKLHVEAFEGAAARLLHLENNAGVQFDFENTATSSTWRFVNSGNPSTLIITELDQTGAQLTIDKDGDLHVQGDLYVGSTQMTVPDFVFKSSYELMPLDELARFVSKNQHLPNVPSAKEITTDGLKVNEMQLRLLEKIEELTLYTLAQEERLNTLSEENEELKGRLAALEAAQD